jgi:hypothetical protein
VIPHRRRPSRDFRRPDTRIEGGKAHLGQPAQTGV